MKRIVSLFIIFVLLTITVSATPIIEHIEQKTLIRGVEYKNIKGLYETGWQNIHIVTADLSEEHLSFEIFKNKNGESFMEKTLTSAKENDAIVAVNGDFFAAKSGETGKGSAVGVEIRDGKLYSSASVAESMNTLYRAIDETNFNIDAFTFDITLTAENGLQDKVKLINKYDDLTGIVMYTSDWGEFSVGSLGGIIEVSVDKYGKVLEKVTEQEPIKIPDGGYVLSSHMSFNTFLLDNVNVGDTLKVDVLSTPDYKKIETAVGGGGVLVRDGVAQTEFSHDIIGRNPRTAVGLDKTGTKITFVVLDGRSSTAYGMTQIELAELMLSLGCYTALNFDGGGSSVMAIDEDGEKKIANDIAESSARYVTNSIGIVSNAKMSTKVSNVEINAPQNAFSGTKTHITVDGYDEYLRKTDLKKKITFKTDNGIIKDGILIPEKTGVANITVSYSGLTKKASINVLEKPNEIAFSDEEIKLKSGENYTPILIGKDKSGKSSYIDLNDTELILSDNCIKIDKNNIMALSKGAVNLTAKIGEITANTQVLVDGAESIGKIENIKIADADNTSSDVMPGGYRFSVFGNTKQNAVLFDMFVMNRATIKMKQNSDFQYFLGGDVNENTLSHVDGTYHTAKEYSCVNKNGDTFITLPNVNSKIYNGDATVWTNFKNDVKNSTGNLFVFLDRNFISNNEVEVKEFKNVLEDAAQTKCVYVFGGGFVNESNVEENVRYINTAGFFNSVTLEGTSVDYIKYVLVTVNGNKVTYEYKQAVR